MNQLTLGGWAVPVPDTPPVQRNDPDALLRQAIAEVRAAGIPVSDSIQPQVVVNRRARTRFGCCKEKDDRFVIEISHLLLDGPAHSCLQVLVHELLHTCPGCRNHGARWKSYARRMNEAYGYDIARLDSHQNLGIAAEAPPPKYLLVCTACGARFPRMRASSLTKRPGRYRCKCGGRLKRVL